MGGSFLSNSEKPHACEALVHQYTIMHNCGSHLNLKQYCFLLGDYSRSDQPCAFYFL